MALYCYLPIDPATTFRLRVGLGASSATIPVGVNNFRLQYAERTAASCSAQSSGFATVSGTSDIRWHAQSGVTSGSAITALANDPVPSGSSNPQRYLHTGSSFSNTSTIESDKYGLWDFSLRNASEIDDVVYCLRISYADGTPLEQYSNYPQVNIGNSAPSLEFVDVNGNSVSAPTFQMANRSILATCQVSTALVGSLSGVRLRVVQGGLSAGWNVSLAPTDGPTSVWSRSDNGAHYDINDPSGSPAGCNSGSDGDGFAGQMSFLLGTTNVSPESGCSTTGLSWGGATAAYTSTINEITIITASSSAEAGCHWDVYDTQLLQTIPAYQPQGDYNINLTATVVSY